MHCALCGQPIEAGESWMAEAAAEGGAHAGWRVAHAGCVYGGEHDPAMLASWQPQERAAG